MIFDKKIPVGIVAHQQSKILELEYEGGVKYSIPFELLRVESPSAEVKGHGPDSAVLQFGKKGVGIISIESIGNYAIRPYFSDGHHSGIFSWEYLYTLATEQEKIWTQYLEQLEQAGLSREPTADSLSPSQKSGSCGSGGCGSC